MALDACSRGRSPTPTRWLIGQGRQLLLDRTCVMGILNVTPDSFSDGGAFLDEGRALARAEEMIDSGAGVIDVGGESTRPGAPEVTLEEEMRRVIPVVQAISRRMRIPISVDTTKAAVAEAALDAGAAVVNDVSGLSFDPDMPDTVARHGAGVVVMHIRGTPKTMQSHVDYTNLIGDISSELASRLDSAVRMGIEAERVVLDPGIGFAKTAEQSLLLLQRLSRLEELGRPILIGPSRKSFIGAVTGAVVGDRVPGTIAAVVAAVLAGARIVRVHDVRETVQAVSIADAIRLAGNASEHPH